jgi:glycosyltransferase involved in cell wall biosynthesis
VTPEVSVVIPTRNRWAMLERRSLASVLRQEDVRLEVIVVDDGSAEPAPAAVTSDERVHVIRRATSQGVAAARNAGIAAATADWTAFLDDDDVWAPRKLREQLDRGAAKDASLVYSGVVHTNLAGEVLAIDEAPSAESLREWLKAGHLIPGAASNVLVRTALLREVDGYDEDLFTLEDIDLVLRLAEHGLAADCQDMHVAYLQHEGGRHRRDVDRLLAAHVRFREKHPDVSTFVLENRLDWVLRQHRRAGRKLAAAQVCWTVARHKRSPRWFVAGLTYLAGNRARRAVRRLNPRKRPPVAQREPKTYDLDWLKAYA